MSFIPFPAHNARVSTSVGTGTVHSVWAYNDRRTVIVTLDTPAKIGIVFEKTVACQVEEIVVLDEVAA